MPIQTCDKIQTAKRGCVTKYAYGQCLSQSSGTTFRFPGKPAACSDEQSPTYGQMAIKKTQITIGTEISRCKLMINLNACTGL